MDMLAKVWRRALWCVDPILNCLFVEVRRLVKSSVSRVFAGWWVCDPIGV